jgi:hypothetical protein
MQGRSVFGGLQSALAARAMRSEARGLPLRVLQTTFLAPVSNGIVTIRPRVLRASKTTIHIEARVFDGEEMTTLAIGVFGATRRSAIDALPSQPPAAAKAPIEFPYTPELVPAFAQHFTMRWLEGAPPFSGTKLRRGVVEIGMHDTAKTSEAHVIAIADLVPPHALSMLSTRAPGSTATWHLEMIRDADFELLPLTGWRADVEMVAARGGFTSQSVMIWGPGGEPIAVSKQCMMVFA